MRGLGRHGRQVRTCPPLPEGEGAGGEGFRRAGPAGAHVPPPLPEGEGVGVRGQNSGAGAGGRPSTWYPSESPHLDRDLPLLALPQQRQPVSENIQEFGPSGHQPLRCRREDHRRDRVPGRRVDGPSPLMLGRCHVVANPDIAPIIHDQRTHRRHRLDFAGRRPASRRTQGTRSRGESPRSPRLGPHRSIAVAACGP